MRQEVQLYIGGKELFFSEPPEILFTFQRTDYTNPTIIKNNYTKTITVEGTPENNKVFGELHLLERTQNNVLFNPAKRVDFELYINGDLTETGYAKLDNIIKNKHKITYELTLYGGLGDFFYGLSYGFDYDDYNSDVEQSKDEELKLKDLTYYSPSADDDTEFNFTITKEAVYDAWLALTSGGTPTGDYEMWNYINFAPCYNGLPDDFDAEKVLINTSGYTGGYRLSVPAGATVNGTTYSQQQIISGTTIPTVITVDDTTYTPINGYALAELREPMTEWDVRDLRSYLQRPVLRLKGFVEAVQRYAREKGGYTLNLDSDFFNSGNTYYEDAWITLPMLQNLNGEYKEEEITGSLQIGLPKSVDYIDDGRETAGWKWYRKRVVTKYNVSGLPIGITEYKGASVTVNFILNAEPYETQFSPNYHIDTSYWRNTDPYSDIDNTPIYLSNYDLQLVAYDENNNVVGTSDHHLVTSKYNGNRGNVGYYDSRWYPAYPNRNPINHYGDFINPTGTTIASTFHWHSDSSAQDSFTISLNGDDVAFTTLELVVTKYIQYNEKFTTIYPEYQGEINYYRLGLYVDRYSGVTFYVPWDITSYTFNVLNSTTIYKPTDTIKKSGQLITKKKLLSQEGTPAKYLIDYCKLFNLYFDKDPVRKIITIRTRANFYDDTIINLEDKIDRSKEIKVLPLAAENKWYDFNFTQGDRGEFENKYYYTWGTNFGKQKVKTEYNFDNSSKDLLAGNIFNNGVTALEKSKYFTARMNNTTVIPSFMYEWSDFKLFNISEASVEKTDEFYISQPIPTAHKPYSNNGKDYDFYPKLQLHSTENEPLDGSNILVFYSGTKALMASGGTSTYYNITDDITYMYDVNDDTCWLYTYGTTDMYGNVIAKQLIHQYSHLPILPIFNRYVMSGSTIKNTWDFGRCNELFVPYIEYDGDDTTIYDQWWKNYIGDLYNVNSRVVEAYVKLDGKVEGDWLKHFYFFDNSIWCLTKIVDYNCTAFGTTKCQFVKVGNIENYSD